MDRRKHSTTTTANAFSSSSFSSKNPYDDVVLSGGGNRNFGGDEIFGGSPSSINIPVIDLSGVDEKVVAADDRRSSRFDYSDVFGGFRNADVAVPYEELVNNGDAEKIETRVQTDDRKVSGSLNSSGKTKMPSISNLSKVPHHQSNLNNNKDPRRSRLPSFVSKDANRKIAGENSPPFFDQELDENSVAGLSAAALKKAVEQARESIRIAKTIMERKKEEGLRDGSKPTTKDRLEVEDKKETWIEGSFAPPIGESSLYELMQEEEIEKKSEYVHIRGEAETVQMEANDFAAVQKPAVSRDAELTNNSLRRGGRSEENKDRNEFQQAAFEKNIGEAVDAHSTDLRRSAFEVTVIGSKLHSAFESLSSDVKTEKIGFMDAFLEKKCPKYDEMLKTASEIHNAAKIDMQNSPKVHSSKIKAAEFDLTNVRSVLEQTSESNEGFVSVSSLEHIDLVSAHESQECGENAKERTSNNEDVKDVNNENVKDQGMEKNETLTGTSTVEKKDAKGNENEFETNDLQQRIEAIKRGREREKNKMAVERAIREARERAFAEARERAMAEARDKLEKASIEAKLRAERTAVERATAEARERALEKAVSQRNNGLKHSFPSSDLEKLDGNITESAQRRKARLERHQRIMERAAKALAEKNMRDLLVQKEQAERNRLSKSLDADIKRWATGKEGNLRALLSTLQYILGPESGWKAISLTEIITSAAVKKAYRKATLYVHPDKLQQRGANVRQKYICEKVFDLLKAAWNRFNSEER
ncbi:hypothetical protein BUALT_Bualt01G0030000 [Buddleja alternifolia]|uniref:J domain-containing protein n=1 Tax=Buddleja alternifolia TaxID=168488 RepID=A0AAV6YB04_9LAMI|nr:hypothetical protein BUALT_Bualt01G0030000 [Buddleja alternifolia]